jgi:hypothetical protein
MQQLAALSEQVQGLEAELRRARVSDDQVPKSP